MRLNIFTLSDSKISIFKNNSLLKLSAWIGIVMQLLLQSCNPFSQARDPGDFDAQSDIGDLKIAGKSCYYQKNQEYRIEGSGSNMWLGSDEFHFLWKRIKGDFTIRARVEFLGEGVDNHRKIGVMIRSKLENNSSYVDAVVHGDGLTSMQFRRDDGALTEEIKSAITGADVIQLARIGNTYTRNRIFG